MKLSLVTSFVSPFALSLFVSTAAFAQAPAPVSEAPPPLPAPTAQPAPTQPQAPAAQSAPNVTIVQAPPPAAQPHGAAVSAEAAPAELPPVEAPPEGPPPAHTGFQIALRTGYSVPFGKTARDLDMSDFSSGQVPLFVELGGKVHPNVFLGAYLGFAFGGAGDEYDRQLGCGGSRTCVSASFRIGLEAQYHFRPAERLNPWIGYGVGLESAAVGNSGNGTDTTVSVAGVEFAKLTGGLDVRLNKTVAVGPVLDVSLGRYSTSRVETGGSKTDRDINGDDRRTHGWFTLGVRVAFLP